MKVQEVSVDPGAVSGRMVLGRMVLRIDDSGKVVLEGVISEGRVSGEGARPPVAIEPIPSAGAERESRPGPDTRRAA